MTAADRMRHRVRSARKRGALWARLFDLIRPLGRATGWSQTWTRLRHRSTLHQSTVQTASDRYPDLFNRATELRADAARILSFGCATGEELQALRARFPTAELVGAEINARARRIAARRLANDSRVLLVPPGAIEGNFDVIFALAVLQREPHRVDDMGLKDLSGIYPFARFDQAVAQLVERLRPSGILCVMHAHYRVEDSSSARLIKPIPDFVRSADTVFGPDGKRLHRATAHVFFRKA